MLSGDVEIMPREACDVPSNKITKTTLCAGPYFVNGCETDSGSPLVCGNTLHALIDYRSAFYCSVTITNRLGTYIDLSEFSEWIMEQVSSAVKYSLNSLLVVTLSVIATNNLR